MALVFRTAGAWGAGTGADLPAADIDSNFYQLLTRIAAVEASPPEALGIDELIVVGNQLTVVMTDTTTRGPYTLPVSTFLFRGEWQPDLLYAAQTLLTVSGAIYFVLANHVSGSTFDPGASDGLGHNYYQLLLAKPRQPYDLGLFYPPLLPADASVIMQHIAVRSFTMPAEFALSQAYLRIAASTADLVFPIRVNGELIGTIEFVIGVGLQDGFGPGQAGVFLPITSPGEVLFILPGDRLTVEAPSVQDATAAGLSVTFACQTEAL